LRPQTFDATHAFSISTVETRHDRLVKAGAIDPADAACFDVCIPTTVPLFLRE
jgi:hypothetical protein